MPVYIYRTHRSAVEHWINCAIKLVMHALRIVPNFWRQLWRCAVHGEFNVFVAFQEIGLNRVLFGCSIQNLHFAFRPIRIRIHCIPYSVPSECEAARGRRALAAENLWQTAAGGREGSKGCFKAGKQGELETSEQKLSWSITLEKVPQKTKQRNKEGIPSVFKREKSRGLEFQCNIVLKVQLGRSDFGEQATEILLFLIQPDWD